MKGRSMFKLIGKTTDASLLRAIDPHSQSIQNVIDQLHSDAIKGLTGLEAQKRIKVFGANAVQSQVRKSMWIILVSQFISPLVWILVVAAGLAFIFQEWLEGIAIMVVIIINAGLGFYMEFQAIKSMEALKKLSQMVTLVCRGGQLSKISATRLVPGDIILIEAGDIVPADARLIEENNLAVSEAILTGESVPVSKDAGIVIKADAPMANRINIVFKGTMVTRGNARAIVTGTGRNSALGQIAQLTETAEKSTTPLEKKLNVLSKKLIWLTLVIVLLVLLLGLVQGRGTYLMIETAIALAIAAIPEGLPIVATVALARGMLRLARHNVVVKRLTSIETLGETEIICTDKTGTLTENQLYPDTIVFDFGEAQVHFDQHTLVFSDARDEWLGHTYAFDQLQKVAVLCNNASIYANNSRDPIGDPLEIALLKFSAGSKGAFTGIQQDYPRVREIPFDSDTKMMGTLHKNGKRPDYLVCIKGALEVILKESDHVLTREGKKPLTDKQAWMDKANTIAGRGVRLLALAYNEIDTPREDFTHNLILIGMIGFIDPPRKEIRNAVQTCQNAGIKVVMVTGDHPETARYIAQKIDLFGKEHAPVIQGAALEETSSQIGGISPDIQKSTIFARVSPAQKLKLVQLYQDMGKTVGMTGDGVNDTPALKKADIGIAMGKRGTEAAREVADLVLKDDAFTSIVVAIRQGRSIFENIRYFVVYLLSCNLSELMLVALAFFSNLTMPLLPLQILFINMVTDVFPAFALGMNRESDNIMDQPPRSKNIPIIDKSLWIAIVVYAIGITIGSLGALLFASYYLRLSEGLANNFAFYTLILGQLWHVFNLTDIKKSFFINEITRNSFIWLAILLSILILVLAYVNPVLNEVLQLETFTPEYLGYVFMFSLFPVFFVQIIKRLHWIR